MISAGVADDAGGTLFAAQGCDLVVGAANLEGADRLQVFRLEIERAPPVVKGDEWSTNGDVREARPGGADVVESDQF